jgi:hypothetical protein
VSAWAVEANLTLGQVATDEKSSEIEAIPRLLELLDVHGALVSPSTRWVVRKGSRPRLWPAVGITS